MSKRFISLLVAAAMLVFCVPASFAEPVTDNATSVESNETVFDSIQITDGELFDETTEPAETELPAENNSVNEPTEPTATPAEEFDETGEDFEDITTSEDDTVELAATGTYYPEWGIWFDTETGAITGFNGNHSELILPNEINGIAVKSIGRDAFCNCDGLTSVTIPVNCTDFGDDIYGSPFRACDNLTTIVLQEGMASIPSCAFENCTTLEIINIPSSVTVIGASAFENCPALKNIDIPSSVTKIGRDAFCNCDGLTSVTIPVNCTDFGNDIYGSPFRACDNLTTIVLQEGMASIPSCAFENCTTLEIINIPDSVTKIGSNAFYNCPKATVYCSEYSPAIIYAIDNDINFHITKEITSYDNFIYSVTDYITDYSDVSSAGIVNLEMKYAFKDSIKSKASNLSVVIRLPQTVDVINETIKINGVTATDFENNNNLLTIPVTETSGTISICVEPTEQTRILSYALMSYTLNNEKKKDIIGVINQNIPLLTVKADDVTSKSSVTVSGIVVPEKTVDIYCDDVKIGQTTALKSGKYQTEVTIPAPKNYKKYIIKAVSADASGNEITAETKVTYQEGSPSLTAFDMYYNNVKYDLFTAYSIKPTITFVPGKTFSYRVKFDNAQNVDAVYIVSNRNNSVKKMKAEYDSSTGYFVANGYFDNNNHSYVPGVVSVEYLQKNEPYLFSSDIDFSEDRYVNTLPAEWENSVITINDDSGEPAAQITLTSIAEDDVKGTVELINDIKGKLDFNLLSEKIPDYINKDNAAEYGYEKVTDDAGEELYIKFAEYADDKIQTEVISFAKDKVVNFLLENKYYGAETALGSLGALNTALGDVDKLITYNQNRVDINEAKQEVINSDRTYEEKQAAMTQLDNAQKANNGIAAIMILSTCLALSGISLPFAGGLILAGLSYQNTAYIENALGNWSSLASRQSTGTNLTFRWKIDPSGYVYEAVTSNRLAGVTATAYWKEDETSTAAVWNAEEYQQANPIITDVNGMYSWDVPEGLWQVKYEKDGYETQFSDWLPVPPPQTDVNIGLVSKAVPKIESASLTPNALTVTFDKYMKPDTVNNVSIGNHTYTLEYNKNETAPDGTIYAKTYTFRLNDAAKDGESVAISISGAESYAGVKMTAYNKNVICSNTAPSIDYSVNIDNVVENKGSKTISANFSNLTDRLQTFDAICAVYDENGALLSMKNAAIVGLDAGAETSKSFSFDTDWNTYKIFVWDSLSSMQPLSEIKPKQ